MKYKGIITICLVCLLAPQSNATKLITKTKAPKDLEEASDLIEDKEENTEKKEAKEENTDK